MPVRYVWIAIGRRVLSFSAVHFAIIWFLSICSVKSFTLCRQDSVIIVDSANINKSTGKKFAKAAQACHIYTFYWHVLKDIRKVVKSANIYEKTFLTKQWTAHLYYMLVNKFSILSQFPRHQRIRIGKHLRFLRIVSRSVKWFRIGMQHTINCIYGWWYCLECESIFVTQSSSTVSDINS